MNNIKFDPISWASKSPVRTPDKGKLTVSNDSDTLTEVRNIAEEITRRGADITQGYDNWLKLGMALSDGLGESGREIFHQISAINSQYDPKECDRQYDSCMRSHGSGITVSTFFYMAKEAGIEIRHEKTNPPDTTPEDLGDLGENRPKADTFCDKCDISVYPEIIREIISEYQELETADMMVIGTMVELSAVIPNVYGIYDRRKIFPPLYASIVAPPASDKGQLTACLKLVTPVQQRIRDRNLREIEEYHAELARFNAEVRKNDARIPPKEPPYRSLFIPANSSSTATYQALNDNDGVGLTVETEGDNMNQALKSDYGNYSVGMRAAFHHESICYNRRKDNEHVDIRNPRWAILLTGTPRQVQRLFPDTEDGLFSRFIHYHASRRLVWKNVFEADECTIDDKIEQLGLRFMRVYDYLESRAMRPLRFSFTVEQQEKFNAFFDGLQTEQASQIGDDIVATVRRLGLITFRLAMVLSVIRMAEMEDISMGDEMICSDSDFHTAMEWVNVLNNHAAMVYTRLLNHLGDESDNHLSGLTEMQKRFFMKLPDFFTSQDYIREAESMMIRKKTADKYVGAFINKFNIVTRIVNGKYRKVEYNGQKRK